MDVNHLVPYFIVFLSLFTICNSEFCMYTIYVKTGAEPHSGTESRISLTLYDQTKARFEIGSLQFLGLMGPGHKYFQDGALDIFSGKGECLMEPICGLKLESDGSGPGHKWFVEYVDVTMAEMHGQCIHKHSRILLWLTKDPNPALLTFIHSSCPFEF